MEIALVKSEYFFLVRRRNVHSANSCITYPNISTISASAPPLPIPEEAAIYSKTDGKYLRNDVLDHLYYNDDDNHDNEENELEEIPADDITVYSRINVKQNSNGDFRVIHR